jgi:hypothetical protein
MYLVRLSIGRRTFSIAALPVQVSTIYPLGMMEERVEMAMQVKTDQA